MVIEVRYLPTGTYFAKDDRALVTGLRGQVGVMYDQYFRVSQHAASLNMSVDVSPGWCVVPGNIVLYQMDYLVDNTAVVNVPVGSSDGTLQRNDIIVVRVWDDEIDGTGQNVVSITNIPGTPGAGDPSIPNDCLPIARVRVLALSGTVTNAVIDDLRDPFVLAPVQYGPVFGRRLLGYHGISAAFNTSASTTDVSPTTTGSDNILSVTVPYENSFAHSFRRYMMGGKFAVVSDAADTVAQFKLLLDGTPLGDSSVAKVHLRVANQAADLMIQNIITGSQISVGPHTLTAVFNRATGSGTLTAGTCQWWLEDMGQ